MMNEFKMRNFADRPASVVMQPLAEERGIDNSLKAAGVAGYMGLIGALGVYTAKALGYDLGPVEKAVELLGPAGTAIATGALTYPIARLAQDYKEKVF